MKAFIYGIGLAWKLDFRNKFSLLTYYVIPLLMFAFMSGIFISINPESKATVIQSMSIFGVSIGALLGTPMPLTELFGSEIKKAYKVGKIPIWSPVVNNFVSGFIHLFAVSMIIYLLSPILYGAGMPPNIGLFFGGLIVFIFVSLAVGSLLGIMIKSTSKLTMVSQMIFLPSIMLSGIMFPSNMLPTALQYVGKVFPATWGFSIMTSTAFDFWQFAPLIAIFLICAIVCATKLKRVSSE